MSIRAQLIGVVVLMLASAGGAWIARGWLADRDLSGLRAQHAAVLEKQAQAVVESVQVARSIEQQRTQAVEEQRDIAQRENEALAAGLAAADGATVRLRSQASQLRARNASLTAAITNGGQGKPDTDPIGMLIGVLEGMDSAGKSVSRYADQVRIAGLACERSYDAVRAVQAKK